MDDLFRSTAQTDLDAEFARFMGFVERFRRFSAYNTMMIYAQRPGATAVGTRSQWRGIGRQVTPDARPVIVLMPFGPIQFLYELGDTRGRPVPGEGGDPFLAHGKLRSTDWKRAVDRAEDYGILVELTALYGRGLAGTASLLPLDDGNEMSIEPALPPSLDRERRKPGTAAPVHWRIRINDKHSKETRFATLVHELGHIYCGHLGYGPRALWPDRRGNLTHAQREIEAEAVSYLACKRSGLTTRSDQYLRPYINPENLSKISVAFILTALARVEGQS